MKTFIAGIILTLAIVYPSVTKNVVGGAVDMAHNVTTAIMSKAS